MLHRGIVILLLLAVGVQALPFRTCAVEQALLGQSCHDDGVATADRGDSDRASGFDGHATDGPREPNCPCETPKGELNRHVPVDAPVDFIATAHTLPDLSLALNTLDFVPVVEPPPDKAAPKVTLPLLI